ncbi:hypothetical protein MMC21_002717 [Puttea exsequens]|nr:hypothetical protein [Puttea exsequens]
MAEAAGLTVGVVALAGLFNNAVQCFEFIQLGRGFGKSFQTSQLKLDNSRLRLSRWGNSLGLSDNLQGALLLEERFSPQTIEQAKALLGQILELSAEAEKFSEKYKSRTKANDSGLATYNLQNDLDLVTADLHNKMRQLSVERQNRTGLRQKAKWALYEEKSYRRLIEDITELIDGLIELFPACQEVQQRLCDNEVSTIGVSKGLPVLREIAAEQDKFLADAISKVENNQAGIHNIVFSGSHNTGVQVAHNSGTMSGITFGRGV